MTAPTIAPIDELAEQFAHELPCDAGRIRPADLPHGAAHWRATAEPCGVNTHVRASALLCDDCAAVLRKWITDNVPQLCTTCWRPAYPSAIFTLKEL